MDEKYGIAKKLHDRYSNAIRSNPKPQKQDYIKEISSRHSGNVLIGKYVEGNQPFLVGRIGSTELSTLINFLEINAFNKASSLKKLALLTSGKKSYWTYDNIFMLNRSAGVFPKTSQIMHDFSQHYLECIQDLDILGIWHNHGEETVHANYCPSAKLVPLTSLEPYYYKAPWSAYLKDKKVLIIHPLEYSIQIQLENRLQLFADKKVLPDAKYSTLKTIQTFSYSVGKYQDWFVALEYMQGEIEKRDFDIAIIGAGAYGLPLGSFVKRLGKQAIHLGGATQILFGVKGKRWDNHKVISKLYNPYWKYPEEEERPENAEKVENGCYW